MGAAVPAVPPAIGSAPAADRPAPSPSSAPRAATGEGGANSARRVLLVEDHEDSAQTLSMVLSLKGYDVQVARSVAEGCSLAAGCDLVISDISLPDGTGLDLLRALRQQHPVCAIALSGYGTEEDVRRSREAGFAEHLVKPVDIDRLLATIARLSRASLPAAD